MEIKMRFDIVVPTLFGLEAFTAKEVRRLGYETKSVEDGRVIFEGDEEAVALANINIRTGERVLILLGEFEARSFSELFDGVRALDLAAFIDRNGAFPVKGHCLKSQLASERDCQAIIKKAAADSLMEHYGTEHMPETGAVYQLQFSLFKDKAAIMLDTSGEPLHKRGYRKNSNTAPLRETIAAAMVMLSYWKYEYPLYDPFCGSGTIPIEAALFKRNIAPGLNRSFAGESFSWIEPRVWADAREEARDNIRDTVLHIFASDTDPAAVKLTRENALKAGVADAVEVSRCDARRLAAAEYGTVICNPPYGERLSQVNECRKLYHEIGRQWSRFDKTSFYILTSHEDFEKSFGRRADKKRKLYNGMLRCCLYQYFGGKPPIMNKI